jgi:hypothetical protein
MKIARDDKRPGPVPARDVARVEYREDVLGRGVYWLLRRDPEGRWYAAKGVPAERLPR